MDNTREKLIELCEDVILSCKSSLCDDCEHNCIDYPNCMGVHFADHLIRNGVGFVERDCHWATEQAYKNGYEKGYADGERKGNERTR